MRNNTDLFKAFSLLFGIVFISALLLFSAQNAIACGYTNFNLTENSDFEASFGQDDSESIAEYNSSNALMLLNTNPRATEALDNLKKQSGFTPGKCGWGSWSNPKPNGWTDCKNGCFYFVANAAQRLFGSYPSGVSGYSLTRPGNFNKVGLVTDSPSANPSMAALQNLIKAAYPGDVVQMKTGPRGWGGTAQHTAMITYVDDNGVVVYEHDDNTHVTERYWLWNDFYNTYLDFDAWTNYQKGISLYHFNGYDGLYPQNAVGTLDVNGFRDEYGDAWDIADWGTFDVYINGNLVANDVNDFFDHFQEGTSYEITDIKANPGYVYRGLREGSTKGTIRRDFTTGIKLWFGNASKPAPLSIAMYRLYNPYTGEHFYTANDSEKARLLGLGWNDEGIGWSAPVSSSTPVYRLYNPFVRGGDHHYTKSCTERDFLVAAGWKYEGIGWYSDDSEGVPVYRQYNPYALSGSHNYTTSKEENDWLVAGGWRAEGLAWYGVKS